MCTCVNTHRQEQQRYHVLIQLDTCTHTQVICSELATHTHTHRCCTAKTLCSKWSCDRYSYFYFLYLDPIPWTSIAILLYMYIYTYLFICRQQRTLWRLARLWTIQQSAHPGTYSGKQGLTCTFSPDCRGHPLAKKKW